MLDSGTILTGMGVGLGSVAAEVFRVKPMTALPQAAKHSGDEALEIENLKIAIAAVSLEMNGLAEKAGETSAEIFEALIMLLEDEELFETASAQISQGWNAGTAFINAVEGATKRYSRPCQKSRRLDCRHITRIRYSHHRKVCNCG